MGRLGSLVVAIIHCYKERTFKIHFAFQKQVAHFILEGVVCKK